jgi:hypothetical protein
MTLTWLYDTYKYVGVPSSEMGDHMKNSLKLINSLGMNWTWSIHCHFCPCLLGAQKNSNYTATNNSTQEMQNDILTQLLIPHSPYR